MVFSYFRTFVKGGQVDKAFISPVKHVVQEVKNTQKKHQTSSHKTGVLSMEEVGVPKTTSTSTSTGFDEPHHPVLVTAGTHIFIMDDQFILQFFGLAGTCRAFFGRRVPDGSTRLGSVLLRLQRLFGLGFLFDRTFGHPWTWSALLDFRPKKEPCGCQSTSLPKGTRS